ncbi:MAG: aldehyde dehydrogenase family protein, partial [Actinomycetota bacterium]
MKTAELLIDGRWEQGASSVEVRDRFDGELTAQVAHASAEQVQRAVGAAYSAGEPLNPHDRAAVLARASALVEERRAALVDLIIRDTGFTISDAETEVKRTIQTLQISSEESKRIQGHMVPVDGAPGVRGRLGFTIRVPVGVVCAITPFNSPLNTVAHKIGPAIAAGNSVVLKPAGVTPLSATALCEILLDAGLPTGFLQLVHGGGSTIGPLLLEDERISFYTFTGSTEVGEEILRTVGLRRTQLELGAISPTIVCADADVSRAVPKIVQGAFRKAGQVCTSVQRLLVEEPIMDDLMNALVLATQELVAGDPRDPSTTVGPVISEREADRVERWVTDAVAEGAEMLVGGERNGDVISPTILRGPRSDSKVVCEEIFGPVITTEPVPSIEQAIAIVNDGPYGLAAGLFTNDLSRALRSASSLHMG